MKDYKITRNKGEWYNEDWFNSANSQELLANAIKECKEIDEKASRRAI